MYYQRKYFVLLFLSSVLLLSFPGKGESKVNFNMDFGRFRYDTTSVYLEVYYSVYIDQNEVAAMQNSEQGTTKLDFDLIDSQADSIVAHNQINVNFTSPEGKEKELPQGTLGMLKLIVPVGNYVVRLSNASDTIQYDVGTKRFDSDHITMSDIELCSNIVTGSNMSDSPFYKNTMEVTPNPTQIYGKNMPRLYYYVELYNMDREITSQGAKVAIQAAIADKQGNVRMNKDYSRDFSHESTVERGAFNISGLESGLYTLVFAATDLSDNSSVYRRRNFYVYNPDVVLAAASEESFENSDFKNMPEGQLDEMFDEAQYLATSSERKVFKILNSVDSKRQFMFRFWKDKNKAQPGFKDEYYDRVQYANENFSTGSNKGWQTDRGRVYILYGPASEIDRNPVGPNENPYEIWYYHELEGGVEFDFVDLNGFGIYRLVNSTKREELSDPQWQNYIYQR